MYKEKIMLNFLKKLFGVYEPKPAAPVESAPYKVPEPAATTPIPLVVEEVVPVVAVEEKPAKAKRAPAKPKATAAAKPKAPAKPRAPKAPKATQ